METLAFASFHGNSETLHLQGCGTADPTISKVRYDTIVNISWNFLLIYLNAVWILIVKRWKRRQKIVVALQIQDVTEEVPKLENRW